MDAQYTLERCCVRWQPWCPPPALLSTSSAPPVDRARHYRHVDPGTGVQLVCDKCPAGTYVSRHCSATAVRECARCPPETFTRWENGVQQCHRCRPACPPQRQEKAPCSPTSERVCVCREGTFGGGGGSDEACWPHTPCPPGSGVKRRGGAAEDVRCKACAKGTFSDAASSVERCRPHTDCPGRGLRVATPGNNKTDNTCGPPSAFAQDPLTSSSSSSSPSSPAHKDIRSRTERPPRQSDGSGPRRTASPSPSRAGGPPSKADAPEERDGVGETDGGKWVLSLAAAPAPLTWEDEEEMEDQDAAAAAAAGPPGSFYRPTRRGSPRPSARTHFDINEHLPWMIVLLLLLALVVIVVCSVKRSSRVLKKGPRQDPSSIMEKALQKKGAAPAQVKERWIYYSNGQGVDILKLVAAQVGFQWVEIYTSLANATEREVAAFSNGYSSDPERAYAALQHWTIRDSDANLAKLINALHRQRRIDVVEKIRCVMEDNPQFDLNQLMTSMNVTPSLSPFHKPLVSPAHSLTGTSVRGSPAHPASLGGGGGGGGEGGGGGGGGTGLVVVQSPVDRTKCFFPDESEPLLRCDSTSSKDSKSSALSRTGSFITKEKKDTVLRQVRLDPCDLQPIFDDMLHILNPEELHAVEEIAAAEDKLDRLFEIAGVKSQEASQTLIDSVYSHLPDLL
ncbi:tumor necrosis factor receptor superfamily member 21 [Aplochiton taeniatus]